MLSYLDRGIAEVACVVASAAEGGLIVPGVSVVLQEVVEDDAPTDDRESSAPEKR